LTLYDTTQNRVFTPFRVQAAKHVKQDLLSFLSYYNTNRIKTLGFISFSL